MSKREIIPIHTLNPNNAFFAIEDLEHENKYDFKETHRHGYFEIIFMVKGGGQQWVDFNQIELKDNSCSIILPKQVHLLKRKKETKGVVIQFTEEIINDANLFGMLQVLDEVILFEENPKYFKEVGNYILLLQNILSTKAPFYKSSLQGVVQSLLYQLLGYTSMVKSYSNDNLLSKFLQLVELHYCDWHTVSMYKESLVVSEVKLGKVTKKHLGHSPLQFIHNRILLEAKRLIFFQEKSIKEISFDLGFSYPSNFAHFIKSKTGFTASQLQKQARELNS